MVMLLNHGIFRTGNENMKTILLILCCMFLSGCYANNFGLINKDFTPSCKYITSEEIYVEISNRLVITNFPLLHLGEKAYDISIQNMLDEEIIILMKNGEIGTLQYQETWIVLYPGEKEVIGYFKTESDCFDFQVRNKKRKLLSQTKIYFDLL